MEESRYCQCGAIIWIARTSDEEPRPLFFAGNERIERCPRCGRALLDPADLLSEAEYAKIAEEQSGNDPTVVYDDEGYPTDWSLQQLARRIDELVESGDVEQAERLFYLALTENYWGKDWVGPDRVDVRGEMTSVWSYHTGGWSGNEMIITALKRTLLFHRYLERYDSGGHYYFKLPGEKLLEEMQERLRKQQRK